MRARRFSTCYNRSNPLTRFALNSGDAFVRLIAFASLSFAFALANFSYADESAPNALTDAEKAAGWKSLFDGKTTSGWRNYKKPDIAPGWKVENGALVRGKESAGDIITTDKYAAFELSLE